jgi:hypothetical protein
MRERHDLWLKTSTGNARPGGKRILKVVALKLSSSSESLHHRILDPFESIDAKAHNSAHVHRRLGRRLGLRGAAARRSATSAPRLGQPRGRVRYVRYVMCHCTDFTFVQNGVS